ncbi:MAG: hypothetical protein ABIN01_23815 [Ferruginibacter sp.]
MRQQLLCGVELLNSFAWPRSIQRNCIKYTFERFNTARNELSETSGRRPFNKEDRVPDNEFSEVISKRVSGQIH